MDFTLAQMWHQMGLVARLVVIVLGVMSVIVLAVSAERLVVFARATRQSRDFALTVRDLLAKSQFKDVADAAADFKFSHIAPVVKAGVDEFLIARGLSGAQYDVHGAISNAVERTTARQMASLRKGLAALASVGSTAPFVGLFGTTFGIINSFQGMAKEGGGGLGAVAAGIAEALVTTAVGIGVAITAVLIYNYLTGRVESLEVDTHETAGEVMALLARAPREPRE